MATVIAVSVAVSTCGVTAFAEDLTDEKSAVIVDDGEKKYNSVEVESHESDVTAVSVYSSGENKNSSVTVKEDVSADSDKTSNDDESVYDNATGVAATSNDSSTTSVEIHGNVSADASASNTKDWANANATGVFASSGESSSTTVKVDGNVWASSTAYSPINSKSSSHGIISSSSKSENNIIAGAVTAEGNQAKGVEFTNRDSASTIIKVDSITANSLGDVSSMSSAYGIYGTVDSGVVEIDVSGDVTAKRLTNPGNTEDSGPSQVTPDTYASGIYVYGYDGTLTVDVRGNVIQDGEQGFGISVADNSGDPYDTSTKTDDPVINVTVAKDVKAENTAISIAKKYKDSDMNITVGGTVSGDKHAILIREGIETEDLNITVWKVETSADEPIVESIKQVKTGDGDHDYKTVVEADETAKAVEKNINYIIRVQSDVAVSSGTRKVNGYDTAHQDETVTLAVTVPSGYEIENFYNVSPGNVISLSKGSADGTYLLVVPRGGGVDVGVNLKRVNSGNPSSFYYSERDSDSSDSASSSPGNQNPNYYSWSTQDTSAIATAVAGLQISAHNFAGSETTVNLADVLKPLDTLAAINNFVSSGAGNLGTDNVMGAGVVSFNNLFTTAITDTVDVPVVATVTSGMT